MAFNVLTDHTIMLNVSPDSPRIEAICGSTTMTVGTLVKWNSSSELVIHATADAPAQKIFAVENANDGIQAADAYVTGDNVIAYNMRPGDLIYAWLEAGETTYIGEFLTSAGGGLLHSPVAATIGSYVCVSKQALTAVGNRLIEVEIL